MLDDVVIIGAGPAGLATAIQLKRYGLSARIFEGAHIGGLLWNANLVENYPGFPGGITGPELVQTFIHQAAHISIQPTREAVQRLTWEGDVFRIETDARRYQARVAVVASGTRPRTFPRNFIPEELRERVFYEVYPHLVQEVAGQQIAIIGAGDAAFDYALNLAKRNQVVILNRGEELKCLPLLWERASTMPGIRYYQNTRVESLKKASSDRIEMECKGPAGPLTIQADYLIGAIGRVPRLDFISPEINAQPGRLKSEGVLYFVGDVKNDIFRQTAIAVGDGLLAAMKVYQYLKE